MKNKSELEQANIVAFEPFRVIFLSWFLFINATSFSFCEVDISGENGRSWN